MNFNQYSKEGSYQQNVQMIQYERGINMRHYPIKMDVMTNLQLCSLMHIDKNSEKIIMEKLKDYKKILMDTEEDLRKEIERGAAEGYPIVCRSAGSGSSGGAGGSGGDGGSSYWDLLKKTLEMVKNVGELLMKSLNDHKYLWKAIYDILIKFIKLFCPFISKAVSFFDDNHEKVLELLIKYCKENKKISLQDIMQLLLRNIKDGAFEPIIEVYEGIKVKNIGQLMLGSFKIILNLFSLVYGGVLTSAILNIAETGLDILFDGVSDSKSYDMVKGILLLVISILFDKEDKGEVSRKCILL